MNTLRKIILSLTIIFVFALGNNIIAQPQPPGEHGSSNNENPPGGGAPIGGGMLIFIGLATAYGFKKSFDSNKEFNKE
ncbi:MAG: hypothetical protein U9R19_05120 [Bacteroidota bacterium]|nr:hypothetical protein [Bacteroidota bacterium]